MKLTSQMRDEIVARIMAHRFGAEQEAIDADEAGLADAVLTHALGGPHARETFNSAPKRWFPTERSIALVASGSLYRLYFGQPALVPDFCVHSVSCDIEAGHPLADRVEDLMARKTRLNEALKEARLATRGALSSAPTVDSLLRNWPEVAPFVTVKSKASPVAIRVAELNALLGLPVDSVK